jgi:hypothetical protein
MIKSIFIVLIAYITFIFIFLKSTNIKDNNITRNPSVISINKKVRRKNLIFTSAGNNANINKWLTNNKNRNYDIAISWYGSDREKKNFLKNNSDIFMNRKDGKFPNFKYLYNRIKFIKNYEYVWITDDDINIESDKVNTMFNLIKQYKLLVLSPSFDSEGKISWKITKKYNNSFMRYTNFIEMTCPIFSREALKIIIPEFPEKLKGWGTDWYYMNLLDYKNNPEKFAIIDEISVYNPKENEKKGGIREITKLQSNEDRKKTWVSIRDFLNLSEYDVKSIKSVFKE